MLDVEPSTLRLVVTATPGRHHAARGTDGIGSALERDQKCSGRRARTARTGSLQLRRALAASNAGDAAAHRHSAARATRSWPARHADAIGSSVDGCARAAMRQRPARPPPLRPAAPCTSCLPVCSSDEREIEGAEAAAAVILGDQRRTASRPRRSARATPPCPSRRRRHRAARAARFGPPNRAHERAAASRSRFCCSFSSSSTACVSRSAGRARAWR